MTKAPRQTVAKVLAERTLNSDQKSLSTYIAAYLLQTRRTAELEPLLRDIMQYRADKGVVEVVAVTAHSLTPDIKQHIESLIRAQFKDATQIIVSEELRPDMIGGVRLELPNQQLDLTVRAQLQRLKQLTTPGRN